VLKKTGKKREGGKERILTLFENRRGKKDDLIIIKKFFETR
jgi:hypothetical protein